METWPYPRLYWTADRSYLVEERDPRAAFLAWAGYEPVPDDQMALHLEPGHEPGDEPAAKHVPAPAEDKMVRSRATKARR